MLRQFHIYYRYAFGSIIIPLLFIIVAIKEVLVTEKRKCINETFLTVGGL